MHVIAAKAVALLEALQPEFKAISGARFWPTRVPCARHSRQRGFNIVSGGTDNHLFLLSLMGRDITGKDADAALGRAHITVNKNAVPNDPAAADGRPAACAWARRHRPRAAFARPRYVRWRSWIADILDAGGADGGGGSACANR